MFCYLKVKDTTRRRGQVRRNGTEETRHGVKRHGGEMARGEKVRGKGMGEKVWEKRYGEKGTLEKHCVVPFPRCPFCHTKRTPNPIHALKCLLFSV